MATGLKVVEEGGSVLVITAEMIGAAVESFKATNETPHEYYDATLGGVFRYRLLTGGEVQGVIRMATSPAGVLDREKFIYLMVNKATVEPKVTSVLWGQLLRLRPTVAAGLSAAIQIANGMGDDPVGDAGKSSTATPD